MIIHPDLFDIVTADKLACIRESYEFRREGHQYNYQGTLQHQAFEKAYNVSLQSKSNIFLGILFEICLFEHLTKKFVNDIKQTPQYAAINDKEKDAYVSNQMRNIGLSYDMTIGRTDGGHDFLINMFNGSYLRVDLKMYGRIILDSLAQAQHCNLLVDERQYNPQTTDAYIQGFLVREKGVLCFYVGGMAYSQELKLGEKFNNPARFVLVNELHNMNAFAQAIFNKSVASHRDLYLNALQK